MDLPRTHVCCSHDVPTTPLRCSLRYYLPHAVTVTLHHTALTHTTFTPHLHGWLLLPDHLHPRSAYHGLFNPTRIVSPLPFPTFRTTGSPGYGWVVPALFWLPLFVRYCLPTRFFYTLSIPLPAPVPPLPLVFVVAMRSPRTLRFPAIDLPRYYRFGCYYRVDRYVPTVHCFWLLHAPRLLRLERVPDFCLPTPD